MKKALPFLIVAAVGALVVWLKRRVDASRAAAQPLDTTAEHFDPNMVAGQLFESPEFDAYKAAGGPLGYMDWAMENGYIKT